MAALWAPGIAGAVLALAFLDGLTPRGRVVALAVGQADGLMNAFGAIDFTLGWTKSLPGTTGRPRLRILTHGLETLVAIPLVAVLGAEWGATGAAVAVLVSTAVFAAAWIVVLSRLRAEVAVAERTRGAEALQP